MRLNCGPILPSRDKDVTDYAKNSTAAPFYARGSFISSFVAKGIAVALFATFFGMLITGADIVYSGLFLSSVVLLACLWKAAQRFSPAVGTMLIVSLAKVFFISQVVSVLLLRAPDAGLSAPIETAMAVNVALLGAIAGIFATVLFEPLLASYRPLLVIRPDVQVLKRLGIFCAVIGLASQAIWSFNFGSFGEEELSTGNAGSGVALFAYLAPLSILSICALSVVSLMESDRRVLIGVHAAVVLVLYFLIVLPFATKAEPLKPIAALGLVALIFGWRIRLMPVIGSLVLLLVVAEVLHPLVTASRVEASGSGQRTGVVFVEHALKLLSDPDSLASDKEITRTLEQTGGNSYFGTPMGFLDRFTPKITDRIIVASQGAHVGGFSIVEEAFSGLLPQTLGFARDSLSRQVAIEQHLGVDLRSRSVGFSNSGFIADGYLAGGLSMVAIVFAVFAFFSCLAARVTFGLSVGNIVWIPYCIQFMLLPADQTFQRMAPAYFWGWVVLTGAIYIAYRFAKAPIARWSPLRQHFPER